jgi:hypothetical protein
MPRTKPDPECYHCHELKSGHNVFTSASAYYGTVLLCPGALEDNTFAPSDEVEERTVRAIRAERKSEAT